MRTCMPAQKLWGFHNHPIQSCAWAVASAAFLLHGGRAYLSYLRCEVSSIARSWCWQVTAHKRRCGLFCIYYIAKNQPAASGQHFRCCSGASHVTDEDFVAYMSTLM